MDVDGLAGLIEARAQERGHPIVVGVSGYCGSGKSTLVRRLVEQNPGWVRMRGDDFLDPVRSHQRSADWDGVERGRLVREVLAPFREQRPAMFRRFDWSRRQLGAPEPVPAGDMLVVDLIGLFHPEAIDALDLTVWCDVDLAAAQARGIRRDAQLGRDHEHLWNNVWVPNERNFDAQFAPRNQAEIHVDNTT